MRRKGELSPAGIDRGWPHQVVLPARISERGSGYNQINEFWVVSQFEFSARREGLDAAAKVTILASDAQGPPIRSGSVEMLKYRKILLFIGTAAGCAALPTWFLFGFMENSYVGNPRVPQPEIGLIAPYLVKGIQVYIAEWQRTVVTWLFHFDIVMFAIIIVCVFLSGGKPGGRRPNSN